MARRKQSAPRYPAMSTSIPRHLHARLQAASTVLARPAESILERALEGYFEGLDEAQRELVDRFASELLIRTEPD